MHKSRGASNRLVLKKGTHQQELQQGRSARSRLPQPSAYPRGPSGLPCQRLVISRVRSRPRPPTAGGPETAVFDVGCAWHPGRTGEPSERALPRAPARQRGPAWVDRRTAAGREGTFPRCAKRSRQAPARPFPSGLMIPNGRKFDGFVAGLFGLGMKHKSASFREDRSISAAGPGRCPSSCSDAVNASPTKSEQSLQAAAGAEPCGAALCGRIDPMCLDSSR